MSVEVGLLIAIGGFILAIVAYLRDKSTTDKKAGETQGIMKAHIESIFNETKDIKERIKSVDDNLRDKLEASEASAKESIKYVHERLDTHLRNEHQMSIPERH